MTHHSVSPLAWGPRLRTPRDLPTERAALVRGLFQLAAWLCDHPDVPLPDVSARVPSGYHGWRIVDQVAVSLSSSPSVEFGGRRYFVEHAFGPVKITCTAYGPRSLRRTAAGEVR